MFSRSDSLISVPMDVSAVFFNVSLKQMWENIVVVGRDMLVVVRNIFVVVRNMLKVEETILMVVK